MREPTGPQDPTGSDDAENRGAENTGADNAADDTAAENTSVGNTSADNNPADNTDTGAVSRPSEPFGAGTSFEPSTHNDLDIDETIITRPASGRYEPTELTGPPGALRPADRVEPAAEEPELLRVVPINPVPVDRTPADNVPADYESVDNESVDNESVDNERVGDGSENDGSVDQEPATNWSGNDAAGAYAPAAPVPMGPAPLQPYYAEFPEQDTPLEQPEEAAQRPRPERIKRAAVVGARVVTGIVGVVVAAAVVSAAALLPLPTYTSSAPSVEVTPVETGQELVCAGSILTLSESADTEASATSALGEPGVVTASSRGTIAESFFAQSDAGSGDTAAAPRLLSGEIGATDGATETALLSGVQAQWTDTEDVHGLAAASCAVAAADTWLVGGATTTGRSTLITLSNPSSVSATVDLEVFGELGAISAPGLTEISVAPGDQRVLSLAGFAPQVAAPVVHVTSTGGLIVANLQQTTIRGIEPGGVDIIGASAGPSTTSVIPGVRIAGADEVGARLGAAGYEDLAPTLRLFAPGADAVQAQVTVQLEGDAATAATVTSFDVQVEGSTTLDLPLDDLVSGNYSITVESDAPVVASARVSTIDSSGEGTDFAWTASAAELGGTSQVSTPRGLNVSLHLANPGAGAGSVQVTAVSGSDTVGTDAATRTIDIAAGTAVRVDAESGASYSLSGLDGLRASVTAATDGGVAAFAVAPPAESSTPIEIYP
jgi:hypothetical protein